jgi:hypothetical protein
LAASRRRLQDTADAERSRLAAAIRHDVVVHLEPLPAAVAELVPRITEDPDGARDCLQELEEATSRAVDALRAGWQHLADRVEALDGRLSVDTVEAGAVLRAMVPLADAHATPGVP